MICEYCTEELTEGLEWECSVCGYEPLCALCMVDHEDVCFDEDCWFDEEGECDNDD